MAENQLYPKGFIERYLIKEIGEIIEQNHPYLAFCLISSGIEFLGKCLSSKQDWDYNGQSGSDIDNVIKTLMSQYRGLNLQDELRNGMLHMIRPKKTLSLAYINHPMVGLHLLPHPNDENKTVIEVKQFHEDFCTACREIIRRIDENEFLPINENKVYKPFLNYD